MIWRPVTSANDLLHRSNLNLLAEPILSWAEKLSLDLIGKREILFNNNNSQLQINQLQNAIQCISLQK